jgi:DNA-binding HxlR family transcriptional regulator
MPEALTQLLETLVSNNKVNADQEAARPVTVDYALPRHRQRSDYAPVARC